MCAKGGGGQYEGYLVVIASKLQEVNQGNSN